MSIGQLVPPGHLLRKIDKAIDFGFIREKVAGLYCADNGRPATDPVVLFKMLFVGYLFGVRSERFGFEVEAVGLDAGYFTPAICKGLEDRDVFGVIAYRTRYNPKRKPRLKRRGLSAV